MMFAFIWGAVGGLSGMFYGAHAEADGAPAWVAFGVAFAVFCTWPMVLTLHAISKLAEPR